MIIAPMIYAHDRLCLQSPSMSQLFSPITFKDITLRNRIGVSPMCMYSSEDGFEKQPGTFRHFLAPAAGGAALVMTEATAVEARGRISPNDLGIWKDEHIEMLARVARFIESQGAVPAMQLAHAGRKASTSRPWEGHHPLDDSQGGWQPIGPSPIAFDKGYPVPQEMSLKDIAEVRAAFVAAARRALDAGIRWLEIHSAHGYLAYQFSPPLSPCRTDYGGSPDNRICFLRKRKPRATFAKRGPNGCR